jgi:hypothetical protein
MQKTIVLTVAPTNPKPSPSAGFEIPPQPLTLPVPSYPSSDAAYGLIPLLIVIHLIFRK